MTGAPILPSSVRIALEAGRSDFLRARIAVLLGDPGVAERVRRRLERSAAKAAITTEGTPPCFRAVDLRLPAPALIRTGRCRAVCRSVDCLCGSYPRVLSPQEVSDGRQLELLAV